MIVRHGGKCNRKPERAMPVKGTVTKYRKTDGRISWGYCYRAEGRHYTKSGFRKQFGPDYRSDLDLIFAEPDGNPSNRIRFRRPYRHYSTALNPQAKGRQLAPAAALARIAPSAAGMEPPAVSGTARPQLCSGDSNRILAPDQRAGQRGGNEVGRIPALTR